MKSKNIQFRTLTNDEMRAIKGAGPDPGYIGPAIQPGQEDRGKEKNFFTSLAAFFTFDFSAFFGASD